VVEWSVRFPASGVEANPLLLFFVALMVSALCAPAGVSGAFLLLPFQVSVLGFTSPGVSPTNLIYNVLATPGGIYRYALEHRIVWPLAWMIVAGSLPGVFVGALLRTTYFSDPRAFKVFVGLVLLYLGVRLVYETARTIRNRDKAGPQDRPPGTGISRERSATVGTATLSARRIRYEYGNDFFSVVNGRVLLLSFVVGVIGGIYSIGGGAIIAPFLVTVFHLPVRTVAGAALLGTFITSAAGIAFFELLEALGAGGEEPVSPDWLLGIVLGAGGLVGTYVGAHAQRLLPETAIKAGLGILVCLLAFGYLL
jgi:uncharacterized protein